MNQTLKITLLERNSLIRIKPPRELITVQIQSMTGDHQLLVKEWLQVLRRNLWSLQTSRYHCRQQNPRHHLFHHKRERRHQWQQGFNVLHPQPEWRIRLHFHLQTKKNHHVHLNKIGQNLLHQTAQNQDRLQQDVIDRYRRHLHPNKKDALLLIQQNKPITVTV